MCEPDIIETTLVSTYLQFFKDDVKWVKISAYINIGPFISTLAGRTIPEKLFEYYVNMIESNVNSLCEKDEV